MVALSKVVLNQWKYAQDKTFDPSLGHLTSEDGDEQWTVPGDNMIKVNCDAAIFGATNCYSYAFAARNHRGKVMEARSRCCLGNITPENAEAIGVKEALSWIKEQVTRQKCGGGNGLSCSGASNQELSCYSFLLRQDHS